MKKTGTSNCGKPFATFEVSHRTRHDDLEQIEMAINRYLDRIGSEKISFTELTEADSEQCWCIAPESVRDIKKLREDAFFFHEEGFNIY